MTRNYARDQLGRFAGSGSSGSRINGGGRIRAPKRKFKKTEQSEKSRGKLLQQLKKARTNSSDGPARVINKKLAKFSKNNPSYPKIQIGI